MMKGSCVFGDSPMNVSVPRSVELKPLLALDMSLNVSSSFLVEAASFSFLFAFATLSSVCSRCLRWIDHLLAQETPSAVQTHLHVRQFASFLKSSEQTLWMSKQA